MYVTEDDETSGAGVSVWSSAAVDTERKLAFIGTGQTYEPPASPKADAVVAINYETGTLEWFRQFTEDDIYTALMPLPQGPDADIGAVLWEDQAGARAAAGPTISDGRLFIAHGFTFFAAEDRENQPGYMGGLRVYALP